MVLDVVVSPALEVLGDFRPPVAVDLVALKDFVVFLCGPLELLDVWVQVVVPSKKISDSLQVYTLA